LWGAKALDIVFSMQSHRPGPVVEQLWNRSAAAAARGRRSRVRSSLRRLARRRPAPALRLLTARERRRPGGAASASRGAGLVS